MVRHPWEITLREFTEIVWQRYGIEIATSSATLVASRFMDKGGRSFFLLIDEDEVLSEGVLRSLCRFYRIPPEDFGLDPEPEED
ncbi:MAG TPA: hypothetical protein VGP73_04765 [Thermoanaerobaculia bacterium]